jgi:hypothetical protein
MNEILDFYNDGNGYSVKFAVTADFNLHIEKEGNGFLYVQQRTSEFGAYDSIAGADFAPQDKVIDYDFSGAIYPKSIWVRSEVEPTLAIVTCPNGEILDLGTETPE